MCDTFFIGLNIDSVDFNDRKTEFWSFGPQVILDSTGKIAKHPGVFFYPGIFNKLKDGIMLKVSNILTLTFTTFVLPISKIFKA